MTIETRIRDLGDHEAPRTIDPAAVVDGYHARRRRRTLVTGTTAAALILIAAGGGVFVNQALRDEQTMSALSGPGLGNGPGCLPPVIGLEAASSTGRYPVVHVRRGQKITLDLHESVPSDTGGRLFDVNIVIGSPTWYPGTASLPDSGQVWPESPNVLGTVYSQAFSPHVEIPGIQVTGRFPIVAMAHFTTSAPRCDAPPGPGTAVGQIGTLVVK